MTNEQKQVKEWMTAFGQETPEKPTLPPYEVRLLRAKLHLEECLETIEALGIELIIEDVPGDPSVVCMDAVTFHPKGLHYGGETDIDVLARIADGCEDSKVVIDGTLIACGLVHENYQFDVYSNSGIKQGYDPLFNEVMRSNWSKMWKESEIDFAKSGQSASCYAGGTDRFVVKDSNGKVIKSPSYSPANLKPVIEEMNK